MDNERIQTLKWLDSVPRNKLNTKNMVMIISSANGFVPKFVPKHLLGEKTSNVSNAFKSSNSKTKTNAPPIPKAKS